jgi:hypothetical protein
LHPEKNGVGVISSDAVSLSAVVLLINTEGDTDPEGYARIVQ